MSAYIIGVTFMENSLFTDGLPAINLNRPMNGCGIDVEEVLPALNENAAETGDVMDYNGDMDEID
jgi:hypothetical protein